MPEQDASAWFTAAWPQAEITWTGNPRLALRRVADGDTDATLSALAGARYLIQGLYRDRLSMQAALQQAQIEAEQASRTKSRLLATMSHEIRTPLSTVIGLLELQVQEGRTNTELIRVAHESSLSLLALIGDVLDITRIESGKMILQPRWSPLGAVVQSVTQAFSGIAR